LQIGFHKRGNDMATKQIPTRYGLKFSQEHSGGYAHFRFHVVTIGPTAYERRYRDNDPDYRLVASDEVRGCGSWEDEAKFNGLWINSQANGDNRESLYGWGVEYRDTYTTLDLRACERMAKTLRTIERKLEALSAKYGRPDSFPAFVARVADAVGADSIVFSQKDHQTHNGYENTVYSIEMGASILRHIIAKWQTAGQAVAS
jgi:hypothetical protein